MYFGKSIERNYTKFGIVLYFLFLLVNHGQNGMAWTFRGNERIFSGVILVLLCNSMDLEQTMNKHCNLPSYMQ